MKRALLAILILLVQVSAAQEKPAVAPPRPAAPGAPAQAAPSAALETKIEAYLRKLYAWGPSFQVKVAKPEDADVPGFYRISVEVTVGGDSDTAIMYISKDGRHLLRGDVLDTSVDPFAANRRAISTAGRPGRGPASSHVTVVDFSDFQCPHCKQLDQAFRQIAPQYPQVRFVTKHFPLEQIHPWAVTAAIAAECAFRLKPDAYWVVHNAIFDQQEQITTEKAWQKILEIGIGAGLDQTDLRTCMVSPEAKQAVEQDVKEGRAVRIANTPTVFINGRRLVGGDPALLKQYIEYELAASGPAKP